MRRLILLASIVLVGCAQQDAGQPSAKDKQAAIAARAADSLTFTGNAEIDNIKKRLELTSKPGAIGFILLLNEAGQPIMYTSVKGKITSSGKRLTAPVQKWRLNCGQYCDETLDASPSDEGTWGASDPYIYFWTVDGQYMQWSGKYLYSDQPIRTRVEPLVISTPRG